jgi:predicted histidine transporter YuiF (NhaC family)
VKEIPVDFPMKMNKIKAISKMTLQNKILILLLNNPKLIEIKIVKIPIILNPLLKTLKKIQLYNKIIIIIPKNHSLYKTNNLQILLTHLFLIISPLAKESKLMKHLNDQIILFQN